MKFHLITILTFCLSVVCSGSQETFCNPIDLSYRFQLEEPSRREAADPTIVWFKDRYFLFASMSSGYWHSQDLVDWQFIQTNQIPTEEYAPCAIGLGDTLYFLASSSEKSTVYQSTDPLSGRWTVACEELETPVWDPAFFLDDDDRLYLFWGCSDVNPLYGVEVNPDQNFKFIGEPTPVLFPNPAQYGWEVPGDYNTLTQQSPWIEGPWINKFEGTYYLQYAGPGTEYKSYSDSVTTSESPLGPYQIQPHNPFASKPEGFAAAAGHGSTFKGPFDNYWHIGTITISEKHKFERRLGLYPTWFDEDGTLHSVTKYADYPMRMPNQTAGSFEEIFPGWMLLSYRKPVEVSSSAKNHPASMINDENIRSYWAATTGASGEYAQLDLGENFNIKAIQLNFAEHDTQLFGRKKGIKHRYTVEGSSDGESWETLVDDSQNETDNTHVYFELKQNTSLRYLKVSNLEVPDGNFAMSGFRVFGKGSGAKPLQVSHLEVSRNPKDTRSVTLNWSSSENATGYVISYGVDPKQLYLNYMVYGNASNAVTINSLNSKLPYFYTIEAFNENGITVSDLIIKD